MDRKLKKYLKTLNLHIHIRLQLKTSQPRQNANLSSKLKCSLREQCQIKSQTAVSSSSPEIVHQCQTSDRCREIGISGQKGCCSHFIRGRWVIIHVLPTDHPFGTVKIFPTVNTPLTRRLSRIINCTCLIWNLWWSCVRHDSQICINWSEYQ